MEWYFWSARIKSFLKAGAAPGSDPLAELHFLDAPDDRDLRFSPVPRRPGLMALRRARPLDVTPVPPRQRVGKGGVDGLARLPVALGVPDHLRGDPPVLLRSPPPVSGIGDDLQRRELEWRLGGVRVVSAVDALPDDAIAFNVVPLEGGVTVL